MFLCILWICPLMIKTQYKLFRVTEILNAWSALEVFILSILVGITEIPAVATFIIGNKCDQINKLINYLAQKQIIDPKGSNKCFNVKNTLYNGCWILFTASVVYILLGTIVLRYIQKSLDLRIKNIKPEEEKLPGPLPIAPIINGGSGTKP